MIALRAASRRLLLRLAALTCARSSGRYHQGSSRRMRAQAASAAAFWRARIASIVGITISGANAIEPAAAVGTMVPSSTTCSMPAPRAV